MPSSADAQVLRTAQVGIRRLVERDLAAFFGSLNLARPEAARDALLRFMPTLVETYGEAAASFAADWYDEMRADARIPGRFRAQMEPSPYLASVEPTVRRAAGALFTESPADALVSLSASAGKYVLAASRETVARSTDRDPRASGWQRVTRGGSCRFCRMLAGRGAVYRRETVHFAAHGDCDCASVPSWDADAPEVDVKLYEASIRTTSLRQRAAAGDARAAKRLEEHNALIQRAMDEYVPE